MDNYLLMGHILQCKLLTPEEVHAEMWIGSGKKWRNVHRDRVEKKRVNKVSLKDRFAVIGCSDKVAGADRAAAGARGEEALGTSGRQEAEVVGGRNRLRHECCRICELLIYKWGDVTHISSRKKQDDGSLCPLHRIGSFASHLHTLYNNNKRTCTSLHV